MKVCLNCDRRFDAEGWRCTACGFEPAVADGMLLFAPEKADTGEGFDIDAFERLARQEPASFWFRSRNRLIIQILRRHFSEARSLLEVGCGTGFVLTGIERARPEIRLVGSELHPAGLAFAKRRLPRVEFLQMDARRIPFDSEFDVVLALDVIEHVEEDTLVLDQMFRSVRPGGGVIITVPQHPRLWSANDEYSQHKRRYRRAELLSKLRRAGFEPNQITSFVTSLLPLMAVSRARQRDVQSFDPSGEYHAPRAVDRALEAMLDAERWLIARGVSLPAGGSLVAVATRPLSSGAATTQHTDAALGRKVWSR
ncbi:MAG TPA: methyltransferase domain-containing protein [Candidatus Dormibacteraeota bacterium]|nr:methyltransferase domain-containing protein [Candidatus Dormibacteraeota bacterium]